MNSIQRLIPIWILTASLTVSGSAFGQSQKSNKPASERKYVDVPMYFDSFGYPNVRVEVEGVPMIMLVDTGAGKTCIDRPAAERAGLSGGTKVKTISGDNTVELNRVKVKKISVGRMSGPCTADVIDYSAFNALHKERGETTVDGIIGADYLTARAAVIDYRRAKLRLWISPDDAKPVSEKFQADRTVEMPLVEDKGGCLFVKVKVDGVKMNFEVDTGADSTSMDSSSAKRAKLKLQKTGAKSLTVAGEQEVSRATISDFAVGSIHVKTIAWVKSFEAQNVSNKNRGDAFMDGLLDTEFFRKHDAIIDFGSKRMFLRPDQPNEDETEETVKRTTKN